MVPEWLLWRAALMSFTLHDTLFDMLIVRLPALPQRQVGHSFRAAGRARGSLQHPETLVGPVGGNGQSG